MSGIVYNKNVYTARTTGYKYRTSATNTVSKTIDGVTQTVKIHEKKKRDTKMDNIIEKRFDEIKQLITGKIDEQIDASREARKMLMEKFEIIEAKVQSLLVFQDNVKILKKNLTIVENTLAELHNRAEKLDVFSETSTSTFLYLPGQRDTRDVFQQRGDRVMFLTGRDKVSARVMPLVLQTSIMVAAGYRMLILSPVL